MPKHYKKLVHEGDYAAEVDVELIDSDEGWAPYLSLKYAEKLDEVRVSLRHGDLKKSSQARPRVSFDACLGLMAAEKGIKGEAASRAPHACRSIPVIER